MYRSPAVAVDNDGNAVALFSDNILREAYVNVFNASANTWSGCVKISNGTMPALEHNMAIAFGTGGDVFALFTQDDRLHCRKGKYQNGVVTWGTAVPIDSATGGGYIFGDNPRIATDKDGNAIAVFVQEDAASRNRIFANRYDKAAGTWGTARIVDAPNEQFNCSNPRVAIDDRNNALIAFMEVSTVGNSVSVFTNTYDAAHNQWGTAIKMDPGTTATETGFSPDITFDAIGNGILVYGFFDGTNYWVRSHRFE